MLGSVPANGTKNNKVYVSCFIEALPLLSGSLLATHLLLGGFGGRGERHLAALGIY